MPVPFFELIRNVLQMIFRPDFRVSLTALVLCFCAGSLTFLQFKQVRSFALEIFEAEAEDFEPLDETEAEDDFLIFSNGTAIANILGATSATANLDLQSSLLSPLSPPPKHS